MTDENKAKQEKEICIMTKEELKKLGLDDDVADKIIEDYGKNYAAKIQVHQKIRSSKPQKRS